MNRKSLKKSGPQINTVDLIDGSHYVDLIEIVIKEKSLYAIERLKKIIKDNKEMVKSTFDELMKMKSDKTDIPTSYKILHSFENFMNSVFNLRVLEDYNNLYLFLIEWKNKEKQLEQLEWISNSMDKINKYLKSIHENEKKEKKEKKTQIVLKINYKGIDYGCTLNESEQKSPVNLPQSGNPSPDSVKRMAEIEMDNKNLRTEIEQLKSQLQEKEPIEIEVPLKNVHSGGVYSVEYNNQTYSLLIPKGTLEDTIIFENGKLFKIKYQNLKDNYFSREGNNLIASFCYEKQYEGHEVSLPYINESQQIPITLQEGQFVLEGMGFYNPRTEETGNYIFTIKFQ